MQPCSSTPILRGIVQQSGYGCIFGDRELNVSAFAHHQRCDPEQMGHVGNVSSLSIFDVNFSRVLNSPNESVAKMQRTEALICHCAWPSIQNAQPGAAVHTRCIAAGELFPGLVCRSRRTLNGPSPWVEM